MVTSDKGEWTFVIDTDSYAGNFAREMAAYVVGFHEFDNDGHGEYEGELFIAECGEDKCEFFDHLVEHRLIKPDDLPEETYQTIWRSPGDGPYNSVAIFFKERPDIHTLDFMVERARKFLTAPKSERSMNSRPDNITGFRLLYSPPKPDDVVAWQRDV